MTTSSDRRPRGPRSAFKLSQKARVGKKRKPNSSGTSGSGDSSATSDSGEPESYERPPASLFAVPLADAFAVEVISYESEKKNKNPGDGATLSTANKSGGTEGPVATAADAVRLPFRVRALEQRIGQFVAALRHGMQLLFEKQDLAA